MFLRSMRTDVGLEGVFALVFPIHDFNKTATLEYVSYDIGNPGMMSMSALPRV